MTKVMPMKIQSMARQKRIANMVEKFLAGVKVKVEKNQHPMEKVQGVGGPGRPLSGYRSTVSSQEKAGKRGRPRKS
jgi:hypothetical protein